MSFWNPRTWFAQPREEKASAAGPVFASFTVGQPVWTPRNYERFAQEAYVVNAVSYRCVKLIATAIATANLLLMRKDIEVEAHPLLDLLARPTPVTGGHAMMEAITTYLLLHGNAFLEAVGPEGKPPKELWALRSDRMQIIAGPFGLPEALEYKFGGMKKRWPVDPLTGKSEVMHLREFNPVDDWYGMSRANPAAWGVDRHNAASAHNKALLDNGARPSGALVFKPIRTNGIDGDLSAPASVVKAAEDALRRRHGGPENAGRPLVLSGDVAWEDMGISPRDMDFNAGKDDAARDICAAWGVPHTLIVKGESTYNNVAEAKLSLYEDTVLPILDHMLDEFNAWLCPRYGDGFKLVPDLDGIPALELRRTARRTSVTDLLEKGVIDADEAREALQYGPRAAEAVKKIDASVLSALINAVAQVGVTPLFRYMRSVGLVEPGMTEEQLLDAALALVEDEDDETPPGTEEDEDDTEDDEETQDDRDAA